jgi:hypothetical protein
LGMTTWGIPILGQARRDLAEARSNKAAQRIEFHKEKERKSEEMQQIENAKKTAAESKR